MCQCTRNFILDNYFESINLNSFFDSEKPVLINVSVSMCLMVFCMVTFPIGAHRRDAQCSPLKTARRQLKREACTCQNCACLLDLSYNLPK